MHRRLTVPLPTFRLWDTLSEGFRRIVASPPYLVGYMRWDARSDHTPPCQTIISTAYRSHSSRCIKSDRRRFWRGYQLLFLRSLL